MDEQRGDVGRRSPYRADIDGLRAVAVLAVVAFHANVTRLQGGFAGVDVFFVISGYLISGLILPQIEAGNFSFTQFYVRRINRILPALVLILAVSLATGWVILAPGEYRQLGKHVVGGSTFSSNFILWNEAGYFDSPDKPLLHLWSLAVEEQFYLIWPALALIAWSWRVSLRWTVLVLIATSFALSAWLVSHSGGSSAFYSPTTRFWEIMAGALLVQAELHSRNDKATASSSAAARNVISITGAALLVGAFIALDRDTPWPGWWAALPVIGTVLIVAAGNDAWINRQVLSNRAVVYVGLISYPFYLWHWPLIVMGRLVKLPPVRPAMMSAIVAIAFVLAILTFHFLEKPIRFGARKARSARILLIALAAAGLAGLAAQRGLISPRIHGDSVLRIDAAIHDWTYPGEGGFPSDGHLRIRTIPGDPGHKVLFLGDSHGEQYWPRMVELARLSDGAQPEIDFVTYGGCTPFPNAERKGIDGNGPFRCQAWHRKAVQVMADSRVATVVYSFWWEANFNSDRYLPGLPGKPRLRSTESNSLVAFRSLQEEIQRLRNAGKQVFIVLSNPQAAAFNPTSLLPGRLPFLSKYNPVKSIPRIEHDGFASFTNYHLRELARATGANVINPADYLCTSTECPTVGSGGDPIYKDGNHMRASFVRDHATWIDKVLSR
ncbi:MAG TPA: acyltransferase family protein [Gemmatimonadaceae bacterium]|nr:acyltransferase family protein [Gemmatimonadaceae bacterium]